MSKDYVDGWKNACKMALKMMYKVYRQYEKDPQNVPEPDFISAVALISILEDEYDGELFEKML